MLAATKPMPLDFASTICSRMLNVALTSGQTMIFACSQSIDGAADAVLQAVWTDHVQLATV